jgi:hypothetical protein
MVRWWALIHFTAAVTYNYIIGLSEPTATSAPSNWKHVRTQFWMNPNPVDIWFHRGNLRVKDVRVHKHMGGSKQTTGFFPLKTIDSLRFLK